MKLQAETKPLLAAVTQAAAPIASRNTTPVLECVLLRAADNALSITGSNLDMEVRATCEAAVSAPGCIAVPAAPLKAWLSSLSETLVTITLDGAVDLRAGRSHCRLPFFPEADFPVAMPGDAPHEIEGAAAALAYCAPFVSTEEIKYNLRGVHFGAAGACGYNGHCAGFAPVASPVETTVPAEAFRIILPILKGGGRLFLGETVWRVEGEDIRVKGKVVDGVFPDWQRGIPRGVPIFTAEADDLSCALRKITFDGAKRVLIRSSDDGVVMDGEGYDKASIAATTASRADVLASFGQCLSAKSLASILDVNTGSVLQADLVNFVLLFRPLAREGFGCVVMGMRHEGNLAPEERVAA